MAYLDDDEDENQSPAWLEKEQARRELFTALVNYFNAARKAELGEKEQAGDLDSLLVETGKFWDISLPDGDEQVWG